MYIPSNPPNSPISQYLFAELKKIAQSIKDILQPEEWHEVGGTNEPAFQNSWVNYNSTTHATAAFYKDSTRRVFIKGVVKSGTVPSIIFTLPEGYRPPKIEEFTVDGNGGHANIDIDSSGNVTAQNGSNSKYALTVTFRMSR